MKSNRYGVVLEQLETMRAMFNKHRNSRGRLSYPKFAREMGIHASSFESFMLGNNRLNLFTYEALRANLLSRGEVLARLIPGSNEIPGIVRKITEREQLYRVAKGAELSPQTLRKISRAESAGMRLDNACFLYDALITEGLK